MDNQDKNQQFPKGSRHDLDLGEEFIFPEYGGRSIVNIADSVCHWLDVPTFGLGPLDSQFISPAAAPFKRVVVVIIDAVSYQHFQRWSEEVPGKGWQRTLSGGNLTSLTSIAPSTTCAAMTSLWTGQPACRHGVAGYEMWMKEYNMAVNMIVHAPTSYRQGGGSLTQTGFDPSTFLPVPTLGMHFTAHNVDIHAFQHHSILNSGLSRTFLHNVELHGINTPADMWISLRKLLDEQPMKRMFITAYWGAVDGYSHRFGPEDERARIEFTSFMRHMQEQFLDQLSAGARKETLLLITADHGQVFTPRDPHYHLANHPQLTDMLHILPTGENRLSYLHIQPGKMKAVKDYIKETWPGDFRIYPSGKITQAGLFGPGPYHPRWHSRVGDLTVIAKKDKYLWWPAEDNDMLGRHGGLSENEMVVPFFTLPL